MMRNHFFLHPQFRKIQELHICTLKKTRLNSEKFSTFIQFSLPLNSKNFSEIR